MGKKDTVTTKYMRQNEIFADAFNYFIYGGKQVIRPDSLRELDTRQIEVPYGGAEGAAQPVQKTTDAEILALAPDYKINLIAPASLKDKDFGKFKTTLREVLSFIKYSGDKNKLGEVLAADEGFRHLGRSEIDVLNACVGARLPMNKGEEVIDVCKTLEDMKKDAARDAARDAAKNATKATLLNNIKNLMESMGWSAEQSMDMLKVSENDRKQLSEMLN